MRNSVTTHQRWQLLVDFDGTITQTDTTDALFQRFALPEWQAVELDWVQGRIGAATCMSRQVSLLRMKPEQLDSFVKDIVVDSGFLDILHLCTQARIRPMIVSDGLDLIIQRVLSGMKIVGLPVAANRLIHAGGDRWKFEAGWFSRGCEAQSGTCKCQIAGRAATDFTVLIGDGRSDFCVAQHVDHVLAKGRLQHFCRENHIAFHAFDTLWQAARLLAFRVGQDRAERLPAPATRAISLQ